MGTKSSGKKAKAKKNPKPAPKPSSKKHKKENTATAKTKPPPITKKDKKKNNAPAPKSKAKSKAKHPNPKSMKKEKGPKNEAQEVHSFGSGIGTAMIDFEVGPSSKLFRVHKDILDEKVPSFSARSPLLLDVEPIIFGLFVEWLYTGSIQKSPMYKGTEPHTERYKLYGFALKFNIQPLMDYTLEQVIRGYTDKHEQVSLEDVKFAYANFPRGPFREFVLRSLYFTLRCDEWYLEKKVKAGYIAEAGLMVSQFKELGVDLVAAVAANPVRDNSGNPI